MQTSLYVQTPGAYKMFCLNDCYVILNFDSCLESHVNVHRLLMPWNNVMKICYVYSVYFVRGRTWLRFCFTIQ